jgi:hypothetical protein
MFVARRAAGREGPWAVKHTNGARTASAVRIGHMRSRSPVRVLLVSSSGGHLVQLYRLEPGRATTSGCG